MGEMPRIDMAKTTKHGKRINGTRKNIAKLIMRSIICLHPYLPGGDML
jgi:hypothetical protein